MGLFDFLKSIKFGKSVSESAQEHDSQAPSPISEPAHVQQDPKKKEPPSSNHPSKPKGSRSSMIPSDISTFEQLEKAFIAFDVETTGLDPYTDRIIELGAVLFVNQKPVKSFSSLVDPNVPIPSSVTAINHITDEMLEDAPSERTIYPQFIEFLGSAIDGDIIMCAHNANFDFSFLDQTFFRLGYSSRIRYVDTLYLSRTCLNGVRNYKQSTLESYFGLSNPAAHRAVHDAENCGKILCKMLGKLIKIERDMMRSKQWYEQGLPYWEKGEKARLDDQIDKAIQLFDKAREAEHVSSILYISYAKIYRKQKDYENETQILDEGIARLGPVDGSCLIERKEKATKLMIARETAEREKEEKDRIKAEKAERKLREQEAAKSKPKRSTCRPIVQLDDSGCVIQEFPSISEAERVVGISSKSIRAAANGVQKHAGGYRWQFKDVSESDTSPLVDTNAI